VHNKSANVVAHAFHDFCLRYSAPMHFSTDNGTEFHNKVMDKLSDIMNVIRVNILPYRPQSNGITERLNSSILSLMRSLVDATSDIWDESLLTTQSCINSTFHSPLGDTPHFLLYGMDKRLPYDLFDENQVPSYNDNYDEYLLNRNKSIFQITKKHLTNSRDKILSFQYKVAIHKDIEVGALVFRKVNQQLNIKSKLAPRFEGPFRVINVKNNKAYIKCIQSGEQYWSHFDVLKIAHRYYSPPADED